MDDKFSCCTFIKNGYDIDVKIDLWARHHAKLFDQVVIADTGSTDGTLELLKKLTDELSNLKVVSAKIVDSGNNKWFRDCKKLAIDHAKFSNIIFLDADEYLHEAFVPRVYNYINMWNKGGKLNGCLKYKQFVGNLFSEAEGWNYPWQVRIFRKDIPYKISIDGGNFTNQGYTPIDRPQIILYHFGYVKDKKKQTKKGTIQQLRHNNHSASVEANKKEIEEFDEYQCMPILMDSNSVKVIDGFPNTVADNPDAFFRYEVHSGDLQLLQYFKHRRKLYAH